MTSEAGGLVNPPLPTTGRAGPSANPPLPPHRQPDRPAGCEEVQNRTRLDPQLNLNSTAVHTIELICNKTLYEYIQQQGEWRGEYIPRGADHGHYWRLRCLELLKCLHDRCDTYTFSEFSGFIVDLAIAREDSVDLSFFPCP